MISLKNTLKAITSKISDINSRLSSLSWYYDYSNPTTLSDNFSSWTATADGMICVQCHINGAYATGFLFVGGERVDAQHSASNQVTTLKAVVKKGDVVTTSVEGNATIERCRFYPLKFGGGV